MRFDIITIFPEVFEGVIDCGIIRRARQAGLIEVRVVNLRDFAEDRHLSVDDRPYGGGEGMVLMAGPLFRAVEACVARPGTRTVLLTPQGETWNQEMAAEIATNQHIILICGRYEGVDQRVADHLADTEVSIGDYVLSGGEIPAMVMLDCVARLLPGALGAPESAVNESFTSGLLDHPQYTRPRSFRGWKVPEILLSGNHAEVKKWRTERAVEATRKNRPDILKKLTNNCRSE